MRLTAEGSRGPSSVRENCHHRPSMRTTQPLVLDRLPKLLVDDSHLGRGRRFVVSYTREAEEIARKFRVARMEYEVSAHSESSTKKASFEDDIVSRRSLTGFRGSGCAGAG